MSLIQSFYLTKRLGFLKALKCDWSKAFKVLMQVCE